MFLILESGNTSTTVVVRDDNEVKNFYKILDTEIESAEDFDKVINQLLALNDITTKNIEAVLISCVVRKIKEIELEFCKKNNLAVFDIADNNLKLNFTKKRKGMGADLVADTFNAIDLYKENLIIIDMGTATTFTTVEKDLSGVAIVAGFKTLADSLTSTCDLLPKFEFKEPKTILADNTIDAMNAGTYFGYIGLVTGIVNQIKKEVGKKMKVVMTGGYSKLIIDKLDFDVQYVPDLTAEGVYKIYKYNQK